MTKDPPARDPAPIPSPWLTTEEAAIYMRLASGSSVRTLMARGELVPDARCGRRGTFLFLTATLDRFLISQVQPRERRPPVPAKGPAARRQGTPQTAPDDPKDGRTFRERLREAAGLPPGKGRRGPRPRSEADENGRGDRHQPRK